MIGSGGRDHPSYPELADRIGEDPARYLAADMDVSPRIRGITDIVVVYGWLQVARNLDVDQDVIDLLKQRREYLAGLERQVAADGGERE